MTVETAIHPKGYKGQSPDLVYKKNTFAIFNQQDEAWDYFRVVIGVESRLFVHLDMTPSVLKNGFLSYNKKLYPASGLQLLKRKVYVGSNAVTSTPVRATRDKPGIISDIGSGECSEADLAWSEQIRTLQLLSDS
jgi:hypothetical protein